MSKVRTAGCLLLVPSIVILGGCSIAGDWKVVEVKPAGTQFPMSSVSFADDGTYVARSTYAGKDVSSSGTYKWTGMKLTVTPKEGPARTYSGHVQLDNKLVLTHKSEKGDMTGVMEKQAAATR